MTIKSEHVLSFVAVVFGLAGLILFTLSCLANDRLEEIQKKNEMLLAETHEIKDNVELLSAAVKAREEAVNKSIADFTDRFGGRGTWMKQITDVVEKDTRAPFCFDMFGEWESNFFEGNAKRGIDLFRPELPSAMQMKCEIPEIPR